jgi:hypothetical protein
MFASNEHRCNNYPVLSAGLACPPDSVSFSGADLPNASAAACNGTLYFYRDVDVNEASGQVIPRRYEADSFQPIHWQGWSCQTNRELANYTPTLAQFNALLSKQCDLDALTPMPQPDALSYLITMDVAGAWLVDPMGRVPTRCLFAMDGLVGLEPMQLRYAAAREGRPGELMFWGLIPAARRSVYGFVDLAIAAALGAAPVVYGDIGERATVSFDENGVIYGVFDNSYESNFDAVYTFGCLDDTVGNMRSLFALTDADLPGLELDFEATQNIWVCRRRSRDARQHRPRSHASAQRRQSARHDRHARQHSLAVLVRSSLELYGLVYHNNGGGPRTLAHVDARTGKPLYNDNAYFCAHNNCDFSSCVIDASGNVFTCGPKQDRCPSTPTRWPSSERHRPICVPKLYAYTTFHPHSIRKCI